MAKFVITIKRDVNVCEDFGLSLENQTESDLECGAHFDDRLSGDVHIDLSSNDGERLDIHIHLRVRLDIHIGTATSEGEAEPDRLLHSSTRRSCHRDVR